MCSFHGSSHAREFNIAFLHAVETSTTHNALAFYHVDCYTKNNNKCRMNKIFLRPRDSNKNNAAGSICFPPRCACKEPFVSLRYRTMTRGAETR
ncbi:hypothetical protein HRbin20_01088 [bacterium HR20]|nr:hypothetical protein HRbin20_01088 [bacterium HR20]